MLEQLIEKELKMANAKFPLFSSDHEGYAVLLEEVEEAIEEIEEMKIKLGTAWINIKSDLTPWMYLKLIRKHAKLAIEELLQVCAVCDKFSDSRESRKNKSATNEIEADNTIDAETR